MIIRWPTAGSDWLQLVAVVVGAPPTARSPLILDPSAVMSTPKKTPENDIFSPVLNRTEQNTTAILTPCWGDLLITATRSSAKRRKNDKHKTMTC